jgi:hypothetical protein
MWDAALCRFRHHIHITPLYPYGLFLLFIGPPLLEYNWNFLKFKSFILLIFFELTPQLILYNVSNLLVTISQ